ncbi:MAG: EF-hand domain-containing protein [Candidatus Omnitrophota bacterium]|nr:EF-hand domain-containing protein [Candidatus Omnitrophota bacterium]
MKKTIIYLFLSIMVMSLSGGPAYAKNNKDNQGMMKQKDMDMNNDGSITLEEWRAYFDNHDWNGNGVLSGDELKPGKRRPEANSVSSNQFRALDRDNNGAISPGEWTGTMQDFNSLDQDHNGNLSVNEFHQRSGLDLFSELDYNNNGFISYEEWRNTKGSFEALDLNRDGKLNRDEFYNQQQYPVSVFRELDQNNDWRISRGEWRSTADAFSNLDINGDNLLSEDEFNARQSNTLVEQIFQEIFRKR